MAIDFENEFPGQVGVATANFPVGEPQNITAPGDGTGTPWDHRLAKDLLGFMAAVMGRAGAVPSGDPDNVTTCQSLDSLLSLILTRDMLQSNGGTILETSDIAPPMYWDGMDLLWATGSQIVINPGMVRNYPDNVDMANTGSLAKNITAAWAEGGGLGMLPSFFDSGTGRWYRLFCVMQADGSQVDFAVDTDENAKNFFDDAAAAAAGYTNRDYFRRIGWLKTEDGSGQVPQFFMLGKQKGRREYVWNTCFDDFSGENPGNGSRSEYQLEYAPPNARARCSIHIRDNGDRNEILVTHKDQTDSTVGRSQGRYTVRMYNGSGSRHDGGVDGDFLLDEDRKLYVRRSNSNSLTMDIRVHGYIDDMIAK